MIVDALPVQRLQPGGDLKERRNNLDNNEELRSAALQIKKELEESQGVVKQDYTLQFPKNIHHVLERIAAASGDSINTTIEMAVLTEIATLLDKHRQDQQGNSSIK